MRDAKQRAHAERLHLAFVEHLDLDAKVGQMLAALDEAFGIEDVWRLGDQRLGQRHAVSHRRIAAPARRNIARGRRDHDGFQAGLGGVGKASAIGVDTPIAQLRTHREGEHIILVDLARARKIDVQHRDAARLQPRGQRAARALEIMDRPLADAHQQQPRGPVAVEGGGFCHRTRGAVEPRLLRQRAEQRTERAGLALADRKSDNVGRRIDLRDKLNVHLLTLLCDD